MTLVSSIIKRAYRKTNLIPLVGTPDANQTTEALEMLNNLILSTVGNEAGDHLDEINFGDGFSEHDQSAVCNQWVPPNTRLVLNLTATEEVDLDPYPYEGQRIAVSDMAQNLDTNTLTLNGNGRLIEGASSLLLDTSGLSAQWMYRADVGWVRIQELEEADNMPFPVEFDMYFVIGLAMQLNSQYGQELSPADLETLRRSRSQLRARYTNRKSDILPDFGLVKPKDMYTYTDTFNLGHYPFWMRHW